MGCSKLDSAENTSGANKTDADGDVHEAEVVLCCWEVVDHAVNLISSNRFDASLDKEAI